MQPRWRTLATARLPRPSCPVSRWVRREEHMHLEGQLPLCSRHACPAVNARCPWLITHLPLPIPLPCLATAPAVPEAAPFAAAIDGRDGKSWHLPLEPLSSSSLEAHSPGEQPEVDRLQVGAWSMGWGQQLSAGSQFASKEHGLGAAMQRRRACCQQGAWAGASSSAQASLSPAIVDRSSVRERPAGSQPPALPVDHSVPRGHQLPLLRICRVGRGAAGAKPRGGDALCAEGRPRWQAGAAPGGGAAVRPHCHPGYGAPGGSRCR